LAPLGILSGRALRLAWTNDWYCRQPVAARARRPHPGRCTTGTLSKLIPESVAVRANIGQEQKGTVMHIASGLTFVRRHPAQSDSVGQRVGGLAWLRTPEQIDAIRAWLRKMLPGAILLTVLVVLGALFPIVF
jgi:hypothetical protein